MDSLVVELKRCLQRARMRPVRKMKEWFEEEFIPPDGKHEGEKWDWKTQPISLCLIEEIDSGYWTEVFVTGPSQSGKTLMSFVGPSLYHALELGEKTVVGIPDMRMANNKYQLDMIPVIKGNPRMEIFLPTAGPGSQGGLVKDMVVYRNGGLTKFMSCGGTDQQRAGFTARVVIVTEAARFSKVSETSKESDPLRQLRARQASYDEPERMLYVEGTVTVEEDLPWNAKHDSSDSKLVSPCPHCGEYISLEREHLVGWENAANAIEAGELAFWFCYECGEKITDAERTEAVRQVRIVHAGQEITKRGEVVGPKPKTRRLFFRYSGWHNMFVSTATLAAEEWRADQLDKESIEYENADKELSQFKWCIPYRSRNVESQPLEGKEVLKRRHESLPRGVLPANVTHLAIGSDVGKYSLHYVVLAGLSDGRLHVPDYGLIEIPTQFMDWESAIAQALNELYDMAETGWMIKDRQEIMKPNQVWTDTGYEPDGIYKAVLRRYKKIRRTSMVQLVLGRGSGQLKRMYDAPTKKGGGIFEIGHHWHVQLNKRWRSSQIYCDSDHWKDRIQDSWKLPKDQPGSITLYHAPEREHLRFSKHQVSEHRSVEFVPGRGEVVKYDKKSANHWFDSIYNGRAALDRAGWRPVPQAVEP